jgi:hypothetical protein
MSTIYVAFDSQSGRILSVHRGARDHSSVRASCAQRNSEYREQDISVLTVRPDFVRSKMRYRVDVGSKTLIEVNDQEDGVGFGFGAAETANSI